MPWTNSVSSPMQVNFEKYVRGEGREFAMPDTLIGISRSPTRRSFVKLAAATALVSTSGRANQAWSEPAPPWIGAKLGNAPLFDGELLVDEAARRSMAVDNGGYVRRMPFAVLRPKSVDDVVRAVSVANQQGRKIAMRGRGHSQYGQSQVEDGIVIDLSTFNGVQLHDDGFIDAQPGALWGEVIKAALARGFTPPVTVDVPVLTVGGTLSVGGTGEMTHRYGTQVDNVLELDVVTGTGELMTCSPERNNELFQMVLAGLGQCGIIVRARLRLVPAPKIVAMRALAYDDLDLFLDDQARLTAVDSLGPMSGEVRREVNGEPYFVLHAGSFAETADAARQPAWMAGLRHKREMVPSVGSYWDFVRGRNPRMGGAVQPAANRHGSGSASLSATMSGTATRDLTRYVLSNADATIGMWRFEISAKATARHTRPLYKMPEGPIAFEIRMHRLAAVGGSDDHIALVRINQAMLPRLQAVGGKIYPPYCPILSAQQWQQHYGAETWAALRGGEEAVRPEQCADAGRGYFLDDIVLGEAIAGKGPRLPPDCPAMTQKANASASPVGVKSRHPGEIRDMSAFGPSGHPSLQPRIIQS